MQLHVIAVGQRMPAWSDAAFDEFAKRMPPEARIVLHEIKATPRSASQSPDRILRTEAERIEAALPKDATRVVLDERGRDVSTVELAALYDTWRRDGRDIALVIGGADGLDAAFKARAHLTLRLSSLTLPHALARVMLAEALYRAHTLASGHPYHRA